MRWNEQNVETVKYDALDAVGRILLEKVRINAVRSSIAMARHPGAERITNEFLDSFNYKVTSDGVIHIGTDKEYAKFLEWGTKAHVIEGNPTLAWTAQGVPRPESGDKEAWKMLSEQGLAFHAKRVTHPGIKPRHFMRDGILDSREEILKEFGLHLQLVK